VRADQCHGIREILRGTLYSDLDILFPKMDAAGPGELFFIAAITDGAGGEAISKRIRKQLDSSERLRQAGLTHSTSHRSLESIKRDSTESKEAFLDRVASNIQELMNEEILARQVRNG
jgi:hypothetical protein